MRRARTSRRTAVIAATVCLALALAACGTDTEGEDPGEAAAADGETDGETDGDEDATDEAPDGDQETVELRFAWWGGDERHETTQEVIDRFEDKYPHIKISGEYTGWGDYWDRLATTVAGGDAPDIMQQEERYLREYASRGTLLDLSQYGDHLDLSPLDPLALEGGELDDGLYGIATGVNAYTIVADPQIFEDAGVDLPDDTSWTWDDFERIAAEIAANTPDGVYGTQDYGFNEAGFLIYARQQGEELYDADGALAFSPETMESWWERSVRLRESGGTPPATVTVEVDAGGPDEALVSTNTGAMAFFWTNQLGALANAAGRELVLLRQPGEFASERTGMYFKPAMFYSASADTDHPEEAALFIDFLLNDMEAMELILSDRGLPANLEIRDAIADQLDETEVQASEFLAEIESDIVDAPNVPPIGAGEVVGIIRRLNEQVLFDQIDPAEAVERFITEVEEATG